MLVELKKQLNKAQERMKKYADKRRTERRKRVGDWVYLKLQPYQQVSVDKLPEVGLIQMTAKRKNNDTSDADLFFLWYSTPNPEEDDSFSVSNTLTLTLALLTSSGIRGIKVP